MKKLIDWNVWHNYSTYFNRPIELKHAAEQLIKSNLCKVIYHSDGYAYWNEKNEVKVEECVLEKIGYDRNSTFNIPQTPSAYIQEGIYQSLVMRYHETDIFSELSISSYSYIRGYLGVCEVEVEGSKILLYPQIKIYDNGVINLTFRIISPNKAININDFINKFVNLYQFNTQEINIQPEVLILDAHDCAYNESQNVFNRFLYNKSYIDAIDLIKKKTFEFSGGEFDFKLCPIDPNDGLEKANFNFDDIKTNMISSVRACLNPKRDKLKYILYGKSKSKLEIGGYWICRPLVNIISFEDQPVSSTLIEEKYSNEITQILTRSQQFSSKLKEEYFHKSLRYFEDFNVYMNETIDLVIYPSSYKSINCDPNLGELIYPSQIKSEYINFINLSHYQMQEIIQRNSNDFRELMSEKDYLIELKNDLKKVSQYGEINDYITFAMNKFRIYELQNEISNYLDHKSERIKEYNYLKYFKLGWIISIIFGLTSIIGFTEYLIKPIWTYFQLWIPYDKNLIKPFMFLISVLVLLIVILLFLTKFRKKNFNKYYE